MASIINPRTLGVVIVAVMAVSLLTACSLFGSNNTRANEAISAANESIQQHNRLFQQARDTYETVKANIEDGDRPASQEEDIVQARESLQEARGHLRDARDELDGVSGLDVRAPVRNYASTLSEAMESQIEAESREIEFYDVLQDDPTLEDDREQALDLLEEVGEGYATAEDDYRRAQEIANANPDLVSPATDQ